MAENTPQPPAGAQPVKPSEAAKVQPKKETVRISLPPKPTAAPTVKLPSVAPSGPTAAIPTPPAMGATVPLTAPAPVAPPTPAAPRPPAAAPAPAPRPAATAAPAPRPAAVTKTVVVQNSLDSSLAIAAAVIGVAVVVRVFLL